MNEPIETRPDTDDTPLEPGEKLLREIRSDTGRYWRDHGVLGVIGMVGAGVVLWAIGSPYAAIGALGAVLALAVRGAWLYAEQMKFRWRLTNARLIGPGGRSVYLLELTQVRRLMGDIQIITKAGDKYLIKHIDGAEDVVAEIEAARLKRSKRKGA
ncbi:MAG: hypothetical protein GVY34_08815 [Alphaproteobacteria bacterium]|jgi:hypothetical protein|nr:hypothetical protein [Alphaproteobacteria bacterium]